MPYALISVEDASRMPRSVRVEELGSEIRVGRADCDITVADPTASREHLILERSASRRVYYAENVSQYGTLLSRDGEVTVLEGKRALYPRDVLLIGDDTKLTYNVFYSDGEPIPEPTEPTVSPKRHRLGDVVVEQISPAEGEVLDYIAEQLERGGGVPENEDIAVAMVKTVATIRTHLLHIYAKSNIDETGRAKRSRLAEIARTYRISSKTKRTS